MVLSKLSIAVVLLFVPVTPLSASPQNHSGQTNGGARLIAGIGNLHHPVTTKNAEAQRWFDQGLTLVYAFNHEEAIRSFRRAAELDPEMAMAHWGIALALGPNYNVDVDPDREKLAYEEIQKAVTLEQRTSAHERAYIKALAVRYSNAPNPDLPKLAHAYAAAMRAVARRYPNDPDAGTLYAESMMDLNPWKLWSLDGTPTNGTLEIVRVLTSVLKKFPNHIGANHLYIHAVEASPHPERALASARRLASLSPASGHLVHMPAHIFIRTGDYNAAVVTNQAAAAVDRAYIAAGPAGPMYPLMYYSHNLQFLTVAACFEGNFSRAFSSMELLEKNAEQYSSAMPMVADWISPTRALVLVRFRRWDDVLKLQEPDKKLQVTHALYHFARGMALASGGREDEAQSELDSLNKEADAMGSDLTLGLNEAKPTMKIPDALLSAKITASKGELKGAIETLEAAVKVEDSMTYDEPPDWYLPVRESLGALLIRDGRFADAEKVFRMALLRHPKSGRSLFGLAEALKGQKKSTDARRVAARYRAAWKYADTQLTLADL